MLLTDTLELDKKIATLKTDIDIISEMVRKSVSKNTKTAQSQEDYKTRYDELSKRYNKAKEVLDILLNEKPYKLGKSIKLETFIKKVETADKELENWNDELWILTVDKAIVHKDKSITFKFYNGKEIRIETE